MLLDTIEPDEASDMLARFDSDRHYLGRVEYHPTFCIATPERDAVAIFSPPVAYHFKKKDKLTRPLELARLWQETPHCRPLSQFLGGALRYVRKLSPTSDCIFSYADPAQIDPYGHQHHGGVYRATGFKLLGLSRVTDYWLTPEGTKVSSPKCYRLMKTKSRKAIQEQHPDWTLIEGQPKLLYVYPLARSVKGIRKIIGGRYAKPVDRDSGSE